MELPKKDKVSIDIDFSAICEKSKEERLTCVLSIFKNNLVCHRYSSNEIFKNSYADSSGSEYWRGWFDKSVMDIPCFVEILVFHKVNEYVDAEKKNPAPARASSNKTMGPYFFNDVYPEEEKVRIALWEAAQGKESFFRRGRNILSGMTHIKKNGKTNSDLMGKYRLFPEIGRSLANVMLCPREALEWFAATPARAELLPEALLNWRNIQSRKKNEAVQETEPIKKHKQQKPGEEEAIVKLVWREVTSLYQKIKEVGFGGLDIESKLKDQAKNELKTNHTNYDYIKSKHLNSKKLFTLNPGQEKRDFIGQLLQIIVKDNGIKRTNYQRLYKIGVKIFSNHNQK